MPEFAMNGKETPEFGALDEFTQGYIECIFFTECEPGTDRDTHDPETESALPGDVGFDDLDPSTLASIVRDCLNFQQSYAAELAVVCGYADYDMQRAGHDFWFTRNGHGVGYWDRYRMQDDQPDVETAFDRLDAASRTFGGAYVYLGDDDKIHM